MIDNKIIQSIAKKVSDNIPINGLKLPDNIEKHLKKSITTALCKLDLVTREEFDVQTKVLAKTRQKLEDLEKTIENM